MILLLTTLACLSERAGAGNGDAAVMKKVLPDGRIAHLTKSSYQRKIANVEDYKYLLRTVYPEASDVEVPSTLAFAPYEITINRFSLILRDASGEEIKIWEKEIVVSDDPTGFVGKFELQDIAQQGKKIAILYSERGLFLNVLEPSKDGNYTPVIAHILFEQSYLRNSIVVAGQIAWLHDIYVAVELRDRIELWRVTKERAERVWTSTKSVNSSVKDSK
jgi:hypothetical protein